MGLNRFVFFVVFVLLSVGVAVAEPFPASYYIAGQPVVSGQSVDVNQVFSFRIFLFNDSNVEKVFNLREGTPSELRFVSSNYPSGIISAGIYHLRIFGPISVRPLNWTMVETQWAYDGNAQNPVFSVSSTVNDLNSLQEDRFSATVRFSETPAIPEFEFVLIPIAVVLGSFFLLSRR